ncbi:MAG: hypothetical protein GWP04_03585 [Gammaproteobacteria bacterium]|nr:hypothetical protein [Gammaproteobacteria bacterium]
MFFDVSPTELVFIFLVALVVFGPRRLPEMARKVASLVREIQSTAGDLQRGLEREVKDLATPLKDSVEPLTELSQPLEGITKPPHTSDEATPRAAECGGKDDDVASDDRPTDE